MVDNPPSQSPNIDLAIEIKLAEMTEGGLCSYLQEVSGDYEPSLDMVVNLHEYSRKLISFGTLFSAVIKGNVVGILAGYFNNITLGFSFISQFHVRKQFRRMQIGRMLMDRAVSFASEQGFEFVRLEVDKKNRAAIAFYENYGFKVIGEGVSQNEMQLVLMK